MWYVYVWKKPDGTPFYVGMGKTSKRWNPRTAFNRNPHCKRTVYLIGAENVIVEKIENLSKKEAIALEIELIAKYGRFDLGAGSLTNLTDGGEGVQNVTEESRARISAGGKADGENRAKRITGDANPMRNPDIFEYAVSRMRAPETVAKYSGAKNPAKRPEVRDKLKAKWEDPEYREKQRQNKIGRPIHSEEEKERRRQKLLDPNNPMREAHKKLNSDPDIKAKRAASLQTPEVRAKISEGLKKKWAERKATKSLLTG